MNQLWEQPDEASGGRFVATQRMEPESIPAFGDMAPDELRGYIADLWSKCYRAKEPETARLQACELLYSGFHYKDPMSNKKNEVTNLCFSTVETVWPVMTEQRPRPEIVPRSSMDEEHATKLQNFAKWLMDTNEFDHAHQMGTRTKLKYGWNIHLIVFDPETGIPYPKPYSNFDFYPDPAANNEAEMEYFFLAAPVSTRRLKAMFPDSQNDIVPDGFCSPGYDVLVKPYFDAKSGTTTSTVEPVLSFTRDFTDYRGNPPESVATSGTSIVESPGGSRNIYGETTFLLQLFIRDYDTHDISYEGEIVQPDPTGAMPHVRTPGVYKSRPEPVCTSGWRVIQMTESGKILDQSPLDECFQGLPIVIGKDYGQPHRFYAVGEIDQIAPLNRAINRRKNLLNKALEFQAVPVVVADRDVQIDFDKTVIEPGDILKKSRGSEINWLEYGGPAQQQFELLASEERSLDMVSGVHDVQQGRRPAGIEAASAIRSLQQAAQVRIRGKEGPALREYAGLLKKLMVSAGKKMKRKIFYRTPAGELDSIDPSTLRMEYDIAFAQGTGMRESRKEMEETVMMLAQAGMIDQQEVLEKFDYPGRERVMQRMAIMQQMQMAAQAQMAQAQGGGEGAPSK